MKGRSERERGADGEHEPGRVVAGGGEHVVQQPAVQAAVSVRERVDVHEAEGERRGRDHGVHAAGDRPAGVVEDAGDEVGEVLGAGAHVIGDRLPGLAVVGADEAALSPQAQRDEAGVPDHEALETLELGHVERAKARLPDGLRPAGGSAARGPLALDRE
jgi:hypothetical protein